VRIDALADERANALLQSYERLRKTIKGGQVSIKPLVPLDMLSIVDVNNSATAGGLI
jgi:hypothetical protein